jgi:regulator of protease activity HflC (stomatin/prohibitin superfamily)
MIYTQIHKGGTFRETFVFSLSTAPEVPLPSLLPFLTAMTKVNEKIESKLDSKEKLAVPQYDDEDSLAGVSFAESPRRRRLPEKSLKDVIKPSPLKSDSAEEQSEKILQAFNADVKESCFSYEPIPGRAMHRVDATKFLLGHRNEVAELADPRGRRIAMKYNPDPRVIIKFIGEYPKTEPFFGAHGKYVLNVPAGYYAKAFSRNQPVIYGEGPHVIIDPTFKFDPQNGFVSQNEPYIQHATINILRVPAGKVAKVWVGTEPFILESRSEPYVFVDPQFRLVTKEGKGKSSYFENSIERYIEHGSIKRIIPRTGEVAVTYNNGILQIIHPPKDGKPIIIDSPTHNVDGFLSTALQTCLFPSEETKRQVLRDNPQATTDERNLKIFQTRDSLRVGVVLVVAFKINDPELAITKLGKDGILPHIENVAFADMGKAIQLSTLQEVMYFTQNKPINAPNSSPQPVQTIQDQVKTNLAKDLLEYGIELVRLNIETIKVLDEEIARKLAGQSVVSAEYTTKQATLVKEYDIKTTEARLRAETENIALQQRNQALILQAQAQLDAAKREAEAKLVAADAYRKTEEMKGELYQKYPQLFELEMAKIKAEALKNATIFITPHDMGNFFNSPLALFTAINQVSSSGQQTGARGPQSGTASTRAVPNTNV